MSPIHYWRYTLRSAAALNAVSARREHRGPRGRALQAPGAQPRCPPARVQGTILLTIGYHQLEGVLQPLKKPMAVLEKGPADESGDLGYKASTCRRPRSQRGASQVGPAAATVPPPPSGLVQVVAVVRHKYLFKARPRALITKPG